MRRARSFLAAALALSAGFAAPGPCATTPAVLAPAAAEDSGPRRAASEHYEIEWAGEQADADEAAKVLERAWPLYAEFFGAAPKLPPGRRLRIEFHADADRMSAAIRARGGTPPPPGPGGYYCPVSETAFLFRQPSRWYTRALLIHEAAHQFHWLANAGAKNRKGPPVSWWGEGVVEHLAHHTWDGETLRLGVVPLATLEDYPAKAAAAAGAAGFSWEKIPEGGDRPVQMHLVRWLATGDGGKPVRGFDALRAQLDRGEAVSPKSILRATGLDARTLASRIGSWLATVQQPMTPVFVDWDNPGARALRGRSGSVCAVRTKAPAASISASFRPRNGARWRAGLLIRCASADDYTIAVVDSGRELRVDTWKRSWTTSAVLPVTAQPAADGAEAGWWRISASRSANAVTVTVNGADYGPFRVDAAADGGTNDGSATGPLGLALDAADVDFRDIAFR
ncbi:MAG: hypothetical protein HMLKMBBP_03001 [Planctomycetes bacterium]|nr:hypothetical protein [Planctomycetota bacterium]